jgi:hypothetical protein
MDQSMCWIHQWRQGNFFIQYIYIYIYSSLNNKFQLVGSLNKLFYLLQISKQNYPNDLMTLGLVVNPFLI